MRDVVAELRGKKFDEAAIRYLEARLLIADGKWREAVQFIENSRSIFDRNGDLLKQVDFLLAYCYQNLGNQDQQLLTLRRTIGQDPLWFPAREALADALMRSGRTQEAIAEYWQIVRQPQAPVSAMVTLAQLLFVNNLGQGYAVADWSTFRQVVDLLRTKPSAKTQVNLLDAEMLVLEDKQEEAIQLINKSLEDSPKEQKLWLALVSLQVRKRDFAAAEESLNRARAALQDSHRVAFRTSSIDPTARRRICRSFGNRSIGGIA